MKLFYRLKILFYTYKICSHNARQAIYEHLTEKDLDKIIQGLDYEP